MTKSGRARRKPRARKRPAIPAAPPTPQDADAVNPALFESKEEDTPADAEASVEDPLQDWPEVEAEKDQWLLERNGKEDEPPDR